MYSHEEHELLYEAWSAGLSDEHAAGWAGVDPDELGAALARGALAQDDDSILLLRRKRHARAKFAITGGKSLVRAATGTNPRGADWKAARPILEMSGYFAQQQAETQVVEIGEATRRALAMAFGQVK